MKKIVIVVAAALTACSSPVSPSSSPPIGGAFAHHSGGSTPIQHIVIIMQENRSFNNLFYNFPGATTASTGMGHGTKYKMKALPLKEKFDLNHSHAQWLEDYDQGKNDGWNDE